MVVDTNVAETPLYDTLTTLNTSGQVRRERLDIGDIRLSASGGTLLLERKTWADWSASICDGRYKEQKARFIGSAQENVHLVYLLEGKLVGFDGATRGMSNKALNAAVLKTQLRDGIAVVRSPGTAESARIITYLYSQLVAGALSPAAATAALGVPGSVKKRKRENLEEPAAIFRAMLAVIPGMSDAKAEAVAGVYPSFTELLGASEQELANLACGAKRSLGGVLAKRILALYSR